MEIDEIHAAHLDKLRADTAALLAQKPDPRLWTAQEHHTFILTTGTHSGFAVAVPSRSQPDAFPVLVVTTFAKPSDGHDITF